MGPTLNLLLSTPPRNFSLASSSLSGQWRYKQASAEKLEVHRFLDQEGAEGADLVRNGLSYRHDWGELEGRYDLFLDWDAINPRSRVFVAVAEGSEGDPDNGKCIGAAKLSLFAVAPANGGVGIRVHIDGLSPIRFVADYLVINA